MSKKYRFIVDDIEEAGRIDSYLTQKLQDISRSYIKKGILEGWIIVNGKKVKPNYKLKAGDEIYVNIPEPPKLSLEPENISLEIIYEDKDIIVINKPRGMVVYPAPGNYSGTLVNALLYYTKDLSTRGGPLRPGIVHRLDKDTSGVMVIAKTDEAHLNISRQLKNRHAEKIYRTLVWGEVQESIATINAPIGRHPVKRREMMVTTKNSREAITHFKVLERFPEFTYVEVKIETGRTHQIRVHMKYIGHPVLGDPVYSSKKSPFDIQGQALHAFKLGINHPSTDKPLEFYAPVPDDMLLILKILQKRERVEGYGRKSPYNG